MDPRIKTPEAGLRAQFEMETGSVRGMNESFKALAQVKSVREQLHARATAPGAASLSESISVLDKKLVALEGGAESSFFGLPASGKQPENFSTLNQHFGNLLAVADSADSAPTAQAETVYREEVEALQKLQTQWTAIRNQDIPRLNTELAKSGQATVNPDQPATTLPASTGEGDDEP